MKDKLKFFPVVNVVGLEETSYRRNLLSNKFAIHDIHEIKFYKFKRIQDLQLNIVGERVGELAYWTKGALTSHLCMIKSWLKSTNDEYAFFCEDDLSLETINYWSFNWSDFFYNLPKNWSCIQLSLIREEYEGFSFFCNGIKLRHRFWGDWSACSYLMTRDHAQKLIDTYYPSDTFILDYKGNDIEYREHWARLPVIETILFTNFENSSIYTFPLFVEDVINCSSTYSTEGADIIHKNSFEKVMDMWKNTYCNMTVQELLSIS